METAEAKMYKILEELKEKYFVNSVKLEFEAEGTTYKEAEFLKNLINEAGLKLTLKIGGCEAVRDIFDSKKLEADIIVAPMIESTYALKKFINAIRGIYSFDELKSKKFLINIESVTGIKNIEEIVASEDFKYINGIVLGRGDLAGSIGLKKEEVNSVEIFEITQKISEYMKLQKKDFVVGGGVFPESLDFFKKLDYITKFETRKIIYNSEILVQDFAKEGLLKGIEFETEWLKFRQEFFKISYNKDNERLNLLKKVLQNCHKT